jgi:EAL domain-containing protein (putative c-di-GMP-specific phosphodiesterase class I)
MHEQAMKRWRIETELRRALERDELALHYQPIMTADGRLASLEALVRWEHPTRGLLSPEEFIGIAEETGLIVPLGRWVLRTACRQVRTWRNQHPSLSWLPVGVNVSSRQFALPTIVEEIASALTDSSLPASCLRLEITETTAMEDADSTTQTLSRLHGMGVAFYMDDFGTGYSSLSYLHRMPIDALKIDRRFVGSMETDEMSRSIVQAITTLAHSLGMKVIAEGVETASQLQAVRAMGCDLCQGFHLSKPLPSTAMTCFLSACSQHALAISA